MVAMSGGVDSSVAALLLKNQGYEICGATMKLFNNEDVGENSKTCCSLNDVFDAKNVAARLGFYHYVFNFTDDFFESVIKKFARSYMNGQTPNPCLDCNLYLKFKKLLEKAVLLGYDYMATGHYAQIEYDKNIGRYILKKSADHSKDQTYFLYTMTQYELSKTIFPLGSLLKSEVRDLADKNNFINAKKPDSQDICFVRNGNYASFLKNNFGCEFEPGNFVDKSGKILGQHKGIIYYTIGQRKKLGMSFGKHQYVIKKNKDDNTIVLGDEADLFQNKLIATDVNLISIEKLTEPMKVTAKIRYSQNETPAIIKPIDNNEIEVEFENPQRAISPGQAVVFYDGEKVVGGGTIKDE